MSRREPMKPVAGLKKPALPPPSSRPRTLRPIPPAEEEPVGPEVVADDTAAVVVSIPAAKPSAVHTDQVRAVSVSVPMSLADAWRARAKRDGVSQVDVLLDAIVAHRDELDDLVTAYRSRPALSDGLFERSPVRSEERSVGISLRISARNLAVIDDLAAEHAVKRSPFVAAVLATYLG